MTATVTTADADGDSVTVTYVWKVDGVVVDGETGATLDGSDHFDKGETITVVVTPTDGSTEGDSMTSDGLTVLNTAPTEPDVDISPDDATDSDDLVCEVSSDSTDADGDSVSYSIGWTVDDADYDGSTSTTTVSGDTVPSSAVSEGETWTCSVTPNDGEDDGDAGTASVTIDGGGMPNDLWDGLSIIVDDKSITLVGEDANDQAGWTNAIGDFDGDGLDDVLVVAPWAEDASSSDQGRFFLVLGSTLSETETKDSIDLSTATYIFETTQDGTHCRSVNFIGDMDGDGGEDLIFGCTHYDKAKTDDGAVFIAFSGTILEEEDYLEEVIKLPNNADRSLFGNDGSDQVGGHVGSIGDYDGDGIPDSIEIFTATAKTSCCRLIDLGDMPKPKRRKTKSRRK